MQPGIKVNGSKFSWQDHRTAWIFSLKATIEKGWGGSNSKPAFTRMRIFFKNREIRKQSWMEIEAFVNVFSLLATFLRSRSFAFQAFFLVQQLLKGSELQQIIQCSWVSGKSLFILLWGLVKGLLLPCSAPSRPAAFLPPPVFSDLPSSTCLSLQAGASFPPQPACSAPLRSSPFSRRKHLTQGVKSGQGEVTFLFAAPPPAFTAK